MIPSSTALVTAAAAASLLLGPALATSSSHPDPAISRPQNLDTDDPVQRPQSQDAAAAHKDVKGDQVNHETDEGESAEGGVPEVTVFKSTLKPEPQSDSGVPGSEGTPLDWQQELKRSEDGGEEERSVLLRREPSAAPTIYGVSIWLILAWLALLYLMYKTGSL